MANSISRASGDRAGVIIATLCFLHCIGGPALLVFAGLSSFLKFSERAEYLFLFASAAMGVAVLIPAYKRRHRRKSCLAMFGAGLLALFAHRHVSSGLPELAAALIGASLIASAHLFNIHYSRRCACCNSATEGNASTKTNQEPKADTE